jgi:hypothetical protein
MKRTLILTVLLLASEHASAAFYSTDYLKQLIDSCNSLPEVFDANQENISRVKDCGLSTGYIIGIYDALKVITDRSKCFSGTLQSEQVFTVVENWIQSHPDQGHESADKSVTSALSEAWSCPE